VNLLLSDDSNGELLENDVAVKRIKEKYFFNYLWLSIVDGLKKVYYKKMVLSAKKEPFLALTKTK
jgi:hypothetical protein